MGTEITGTLAGDPGRGLAQTAGRWGPPGQSVFSTARWETLLEHPAGFAGQSCVGSGRGCSPRSPASAGRPGGLQDRLLAPLGRLSPRSGRMRDDKQGLLRLAVQETRVRCPRGAVGTVPRPTEKPVALRDRRAPPLGQKEPGDDAAPSPSPSHEPDNRQRGSPPRATLNWLGHFSQGVLVALLGCPQDRLHDLGSPIKSTALSHTSHFVNLESRTDAPAAGTPPEVRAYRPAGAWPPNLALTLSSTSARAASSSAGQAATTSPNSGGNSAARATTAPDIAPPTPESAVFPDVFAPCSTLLRSTSHKSKSNQDLVIHSGGRKCGLQTVTKWSSDHF